MARLAPDAEIPAWAACAPLGSDLAGGFVSITRTREELSIVAPSALMPPEVRAERGFSLLRLAGTIPFSETGVLKSLLDPLADEGISILAIATFDTDYLLVRSDDLGRAAAAFARAGIVTE